MWENCHDYDAEVEAQMKPQPEQPNPIDLTRLEALLAARSESPGSYSVYLMTLLCNAPALLRELKDLRARVAELERKGGE